MFGIPLSGLSLPVAGVGFVFSQSNLAGKVIVVLLFAGSVWAWSLMLTKFKELVAAKRESAGFLAAYRLESHPVSLFQEGRSRCRPSPLLVIYDQACSALGASLEASSENTDDLFVGGGAPRIRLSERHIGSVKNASERTVADQALLLENNMGLLATAASTAPFLGLLGTVWGVMESFGNMASSGPALLSDVAPGISGALLTTVVGLLVALPSSIGYNLLSDRIRSLTVLMDNFAQELVGDLERVHLP
jgi:biopolymer transport protein TolQ